jgi:hypothetical protein
MKLNYNEVFEITSDLTLYIDMEYPDTIESIEIERQESNVFNHCMKFKFEFEFEEWKNPWSIIEFANEMNDVTNTYNNQDVAWEQSDEDFVSNGSYIVFNIKNLYSSIGKEFKDNVIILNDIYNKVIASLTTKTKMNSLVSMFDFPDEIRVPCEQYLMYFAQFLKEIGIEAKTDLHHEAGKTLFTVTPITKDEAMERIEKALNLYIQLPSHQAFNNYMMSLEDIKVQQLAANIHHLKGQIMLANAQIQAHNSTIQNQALLIEQQRSIINMSILKESIINLKDAKIEENKEKLLGGTVAITKLEKDGFEIDLPLIYRNIKKYLGIK